MSTPAVNCPRLPRPVELPERDEPAVAYEPRNGSEYLALQVAVKKVSAFIGLLNIAEKIVSEMGAGFADELSGYLPNIRPLDIEDDIRAAVEYSRKLEAAKRAYEQREDV